MKGSYRYYKRIHQLLKWSIINWWYFNFKIEIRLILQNFPCKGGIDGRQDGLSQHVITQKCAWKTSTNNIHRTWMTWFQNIASFVARSQSSRIVLGKKQTSILNFLSNFLEINFLLTLRMLLLLKSFPNFDTKTKVFGAREKKKI